MYETIRLKLRKLYIKLTSKFRKQKIKNMNFSIISNNCWGGFIYQSYNLKYNTPTLGMFFMADDYIKFISDIKKYLNHNITFIHPNESKWYEEVKHTHNYGNYPVARLKDIELFFLHYNSEEEALNKWNKRKERINFDNILYKFSEMNCCSQKHIKEFQKLNLKNKICFISKKNKGLKNNYTYVVAKNEVTASREPFGHSNVVNINNIINKMEK